MCYFDRKIFAMQHVPFGICNWRSFDSQPATTCLNIFFVLFYKPSIHLVLRVFFKGFSRALTFLDLRHDLCVHRLAFIEEVFKKSLNLFQNLNLFISYIFLQKQTTQ